MQSSESISEAPKDRGEQIWNWNLDSKIDFLQSVNMTNIYASIYASPQLSTFRRLNQILIAQ